jgi:hypothetical protein
MRTLERVSSSGVLESRGAGEQGAREGVRPQTRLLEAWIRIQSTSLSMHERALRRTCSMPAVQRERARSDVKRIILCGSV